MAVVYSIAPPEDHSQITLCCFKRSDKFLKIRPGDYSNPKPRQSSMRVWRSFSKNGFVM
jgi:hypothetical protein